jgi:CARDB protein
MRVRLMTASLGLALVASVPALGADAGSDTQQRGLRLASVRLVECVHAQHTAAFYGRMRWVQGADRMGMRFTLLDRSGATAPQPVRVPGLGVWRKSRPGRKAFGFTQRVRSLVDGHSYRVRVDFRWYSEDGTVVRRTRRRSPTCRQFGPRPNLTVEVLGAKKTEVAGVLRYFVSVRDDGHAPASNAAVRLTVDGAEVNTRTVPLLAPGDERSLTFRGPACERTVVATADPANAIPESSETDNTDSKDCAEVRP